MLTIEPPPAWHIASPKTWVALKTPATLTSSVRRNDASPTSPGGASMPALLTRIAGVPISAEHAPKRRAVGDVRLR